MARLALALAAAAAASSQAAPTAGTADQIFWQGQGTGASDMAVFIHYNMATAAGTQGCGGCDGKAPPSIDLWSPSALDTDAWIREGMAMGATRFIYVAKHGCGFAAWNSSTDYPYSAAKSKAPNADVVAAFVASAKKFGVGYGFYYSVVSNQLFNVCQGTVHPNAGPGQIKVTQEEYDSIVLKQVTELWSQFGPLAEVWFDGGYTQSLKPHLIKLLQELQPHVVAFGGVGLVASPARWIGNEGGQAPYPTWSTATASDVQGGGSPDGELFVPAETDFTLQNGDQWFYNKDAGVHPPAQLRQMYEGSAGHNSPVIIDFAPFPNGSLPVDQVAAARTLGAFLKGCYGKPLAKTSAQGAQARNLTLALAQGGSTIDRILLSEDMTATRAQFVRAFAVEATLTSGARQTLVAEGSSIGAKFIAVLDKPVANVASVSLNISQVAAGTPDEGPFIGDFAAFSCSGLANDLDSQWASQAFHQPSASWAPAERYVRPWAPAPATAERLVV